ncbi:hypothetical protein LAT59_02540 [Candidatus Gracilibacteria bacterium]|nr:hypothetical protein [Candidatus Gracilibacteria bacterium]
MPEEKKSPPEVGNIFDDFVIDEGLKKEVEKEEQASKKDVFYFITKGNIIFSTINIILLLFVVLVFGYIFVQKSEEAGIYSFLEPFCTAFVGRGDIYSSGCSSVTYTSMQYKQLIEREEGAQIDLLAPLLADVYSLEDFFSSRRVDFTLDTSFSRLRPLEILEEFDSLQAQFAPIDKLEVYCPDISMDSDLRIELSCISYSSDWDRSLSRLEDGILRQTDNIGGTSISKAANFIDFIENTPGSRFRIVDRPTTFSSITTQFGQYTKRTNFRFVVEYQSEALIY